MESGIKDSTFSANFLSIDTLLYIIYILVVSYLNLMSYDQKLDRIIFPTDLVMSLIEDWSIKKNGKRSIWNSF